MGFNICFSIIGLVEGDKLILTIPKSSSMFFNELNGAVGVVRGAREIVVDITKSIIKKKSFPLSFSGTSTSNGEIKIRYEFVIDRQFVVVFI